MTSPKTTLATTDSEGRFVEVSVYSIPYGEFPWVWSATPPEGTSSFSSSQLEGTAASREEAWFCAGAWLQHYLSIVE